MSSDDSDIELIGASSQQPEPLTRPPLTATRSQTINLVATSDLEPEEETLPVLPVLSQNHTTNPGKGKKRAMDPFDEPVHVPQPETRPERPAAAMPVKRKSTGESSKSSVETGKTKKARVGADGLTAAERKEKKASDLAAKKSFRQDNRKMTGRKGALSEIVINATDSLHSSRWFGKTLTNLQEDIKLSDDEGKYEPGTLEIISPPTALQSTKPALVTFRRVTNKYLDASNGQFLRYSDRKTRSVPEKHVIFLLHASEVDKSVGQGTLLQQIQDIKSCIGCPLQTTQESDWQFILLVQGLSAYARSEKRVQDDSNSRSCSYADIDQTLTELVVLERVFLIRSESGAETQRWLFELSIDIAYKPYKMLDRAPMDALGIDGTSKGKAVSTGNEKGLANTYVSMLASMHQITDGQAESIVRVYPTFSRLLQAFEQQATEKAKERMLVGLPMIRNKDGAQTSREIGKDTSKRIYLQLFSKEPHLSLQTMKGL